MREREMLQAQRALAIGEGRTTARQCDQDLVGRMEQEGVAVVRAEERRQHSDRVLERAGQVHRPERLQARE